MARWAGEEFKDGFVAQQRTSDDRHDTRRTNLHLSHISLVAASPYTAVSPIAGGDEKSRRLSRAKLFRNNKTPSFVRPSDSPHTPQPKPTKLRRPRVHWGDRIEMLIGSMRKEDVGKSSREKGGFEVYAGSSNFCPRRTLVK
jgi:hypothetical protein